MNTWTKTLVAIVVAAAMLSCASLDEQDNRKAPALMYTNFSLGAGGAGNASFSFDFYGERGGIVGGGGFRLFDSPDSPGFYDWTCPHNDVTYLGQFPTAEWEVYGLLGVRPYRSAIFLVVTLGVSVPGLVELEQSNVTGWTYLAYWTSTGAEAPAPYLTVGGEIRYIVPDTHALVSVGLHNRRGLTVGGGLRF